MKITAYNQYDVGSSHEPWSCFIAYQSTRDGPTSLSNQAKHEVHEVDVMRSRRIPSAFSDPPRLRLHQELPIPHNLLFIHPDIKLPPHHIDMRRRIPLRARMRSVRISKRNMHARIFLILQNLPDHIFQIDVRSNGKLTHAIAVFIGVRVLPAI